MIESMGWVRCCGGDDMRSSTAASVASRERRLRFTVFMPILAALVAVLVASAAGTVFAESLLSAAQIVAALEREPPLPPKGGFVPKANPDAATRVCDAELNRRLLRDFGQRGELLTRNLYAEAAPTVDLDIAFAFGEAALLAEGKAQLDELARALRSPGLRGDRFVLAGHTDQVGSADFNDRLSCERALSARRYLVEQHRIEPDRLLPMGFGFTKLRNLLDPGAAVNRRVEVRRFAGLQKSGQP